MSEISLPIALQLWLPEIQTGLGHPGQFAVDIWVPMPEAAVHENRLLKPRKEEVGRAGQSSIVKAISESHRMNQAPDQHLWFAVPVSHFRHASAAFCRGERIHCLSYPLSGRIRQLRKAKGLSQEGLALESDLDRSYIGGVERGERDVALVNIHRVAMALGVRAGELFAD